MIETHSFSLSERKEQSDNKNKEWMKHPKRGLDILNFCDCVKGMDFTVVAHKQL